MQCAYGLHVKLSMSTHVALAKPNPHASKVSMCCLRGINFCEEKVGAIEECATGSRYHRVVMICLEHN